MVRLGLIGLLLIALVSATGAQSGERIPCVAVLLMGSEAESLAAEEVLYQMGIPHYVTRSPEVSRRAAMVLVSFGQVERVDRNLALSLLSYVEQGGILVAQKPRASSLAPIFGYQKAIASKGRHEIIWEPIDAPLKAYVDAPEEEVIRLGSYSHDELFWTIGYVTEDATVLARFEDGTAAITERKTGNGRAIAIGGSLIDLVIRSYLDRDFGVQKVGSNSFEPSTDMTLLFIKAAYRQYVPDGLTISTMPPGKPGALIITHDIDAQSSFENIDDFARLEKRYGTTSTIFLQTKYVDDYYDTDFMTLENLSKMRKLASEGFEIASHTVSHTQHFPRLPLGEIVKDPDFYRPRIVSMTETVNATVRGEVWVSKSIISSNGMPPPRSFRTGHLVFNRYLVNVLKEAGYLYDSSMGVYHCACNFPFRQFRNRSFRTQSDIIEIPVTMSDYDWLEDMTRLLPNFKQILIKNADNGAPVTLLIHPTRKADKLESLDLLLRWLPRNFWVGTLEDFGKFWCSRYSLNPVIQSDGDFVTYTFRPERSTEPVKLELNSPADSIITEPPALIDDPETITLPGLKRGSQIRVRILTRSCSQPLEPAKSPGEILDPVEHRISLSTGFETYRDYDRTGSVPILRGSLWIRKYLPGVWGIKLWDYFSWRPGEAGEGINEGGLTFGSHFSKTMRTWMRLINRTYLRRFPHSELRFNEPRFEITLKRSTDAASFILDSSVQTAFYSSPDSIVGKTYIAFRLKPSVRFDLTPRLSVSIDAGFTRRTYREEKLNDIYATDFDGYKAGIDLSLRSRTTNLGASLGWTLRRYTGGKDRTSLSAAITLDRSVRTDLSLESRIAYSEAEFTEPEYDRFYWGEALTAYSAKLDLKLRLSQSRSLKLGTSWRLEDYKQSHFRMHYFSIALGISTTLGSLLW